MEEIDKDIPPTYFAAVLCRPLFMASRPDRSETSFWFHDVDACLEGAAQTIKWKGYFDLKEACKADSAAVSSHYPDDSLENLTRQCVTQNIDRWAAREKQRCQMRHLFPPSGCR